MPLHSLRRGRGVLIPVLAVSAALAVCWGGSPIAAATTKHPKPKHHSLALAGKWSGQYNGAFSGTFTLQWTQTGSSLHGNIKLSNPSGTYGVTGSVHNGAITFGVVGAGATYTGTATSTSMSGNYHTPRGGGAWSAHKTS